MNKCCATRSWILTEGMTHLEPTRHQDNEIRLIRYAFLTDLWSRVESGTEATNMGCATRSWILAEGMIHLETTRDQDNEIRLIRDALA